MSGPEGEEYWNLNEITLYQRVSCRIYEILWYAASRMTIFLTGFSIWFLIDYRDQGQAVGFHEWTAQNNLYLRNKNSRRLH